MRTLSFLPVSLLIPPLHRRCSTTIDLSVLRRTIRRLRFFCLLSRSILGDAC